MKIFRATLLILTSLLIVTVRADVTLATPFRDGAILQRDKPVAVWGTAAPDETVRVEFVGRVRSAGNTKADARGRWRVDLAPMAASAEPGKLMIAGHNVITVSDVLVGDVWLCSGQSNMMMMVREVNDAQKELAVAHYPLIRHFTVQSVVSESPLLQADGVWQATTPENVKEFTATGYFFALNLQRELGVPIGIIKATLGGSPIEGWMSQEALASDPAFGVVYKRWDGMKGRATGKALRNMPSGLYNGLIVPMEPYTLKGFLWYQGEANYQYHQEYGLLFRAMITQWRRAFKQGDLPFLFVQLPGFDEPTDPTKQGWAWRREEQASALNLPHVSMAVTVDIGDPRDIHPKNKQEVGRRLALVALKDIYGRDIQARGPIFDGATREGSSFRLHFRNADGLELIGEPRGAFLIAGENRAFVPADAKVEGNDVMVSAAEVSAPVAVRFAWSNNPTAFLVNRAKLPAAPFRTDRWE
jgi:sialate O-acetylesterase